MLTTYLAQIQTTFNTGQATEHSYRRALETLLQELNPNIIALNESQRITGVGMPDFTIMSKKDQTIKIGRIEAKDLRVDLDEKKNKDQLGRYLAAFDNFIYTNNLTFNFYVEGKRVQSVSLGSATKTELTLLTGDELTDAMTTLEHLLRDFLSYQGQTISSPEKLARAMAQKAQLIKHAMTSILHGLDREETAIWNQYQTFKTMLIHDLTETQFADMYAQTIAYGLFAARLYDPTLSNFSRKEAENLIPKTTPFVRWLFRQMSMDDEFDDRIAHIIDGLVDIFLHCNVAEIIKDHGKQTEMNDPIIHFYETFLGEYDPSMRKQRGVYYTPDPVVKFIVRGVDHLLREEFGLSQGLADTSTVSASFLTNEYDGRTRDNRKKISRDVHRVQVLDPATGTGTFLNETIRYIHETYFARMPGAWSGYVSNDLLPRLRGFEILMASYTMAHLSLGLTIQETLGISTSEASTCEEMHAGLTDRLNVYLTNSLEEPHDHIQTLFSKALSEESSKASRVKKEQPIMIVMGNPPYSGESTNKGDWILDLMNAYKQEPGGKQKLQERNSKRINDDYVKFIRYAEHFIEKNNEGIVAYICPHGFLDNPTFRGMRRHLLSTFDRIYTIDLHGNSKKKETDPNGGKDENVFDIQQGVSINFLVKGNASNRVGTDIDPSASEDLATVYHCDLYGTRPHKYQWLCDHDFADVQWTKLENVAPNYFFVPKDFELQAEYDTFISVNDLFPVNSVGVVTGRDSLVIAKTKDELGDRISDIFHLSLQEAKEKYTIKENKNRQLSHIQNATAYDAHMIQQVSYRPFDKRYVYFDTKYFIERSREKVMHHFLAGDNVGLVTKKGFPEDTAPGFIVNSIIDFRSWSRPGMQGGDYIFPLYLYEPGFDGEMRRVENLNMDIINQLEEKRDAQFTPDEYAEFAGGRDDDDDDDTVFPGTFFAENILDYVYAILHCPSYRETYKEFLKIDFPRVPFTDDRQKFRDFVLLGHRLRHLHLMSTFVMQDLRKQSTVSYPVDGDNIVDKIGKGSFENHPPAPSLPKRGSTGRVKINETQYFDGVSETARNFYIGGYQPAQKRLKDRQGQALSYDDIGHYMDMIAVLDETASVMDEIDGLW